MKWEKYMEIKVTWFLKICQLFKSLHYLFCIKHITWILFYFSQTNVLLVVFSACVLLPDMLLLSLPHPRAGGKALATADDKWIVPLFLLSCLFISVNFVKGCPVWIRSAGKHLPWTSGVVSCDSISIGMSSDATEAINQCLQHHIQRGVMGWLFLCFCVLYHKTHWWCLILVLLKMNNFFG